MSQVSPGWVLSLFSAALVATACGGPSGLSAELVDDFDQPVAVDDPPSGDDETDTPGEPPLPSASPTSDSGEGVPPEPADVDAGAVTPDAGQDDDAGPPRPTSCDAPAACIDATDLKELDADKGSKTIEYGGTTSMWLKVRLVEADWGISPVKLKADLVSPPGANFDLFLYAPQKGGTSDLECTTVLAASEGSAGADAASVQFSDTALSDDGRFVTIEVRHVSGPCTETPWQLTLSGNK